MYIHILTFINDIADCLMQRQPYHKARQHHNKGNECPGKGKKMHTHPSPQLAELESQNSDSVCCEAIVKRLGRLTLWVSDDHPDLAPTLNIFVPLSFCTWGTCPTAPPPPVTLLQPPRAAHYGANEIHGTTSEQGLGPH